MNAPSSLTATALDQAIARYRRRGYRVVSRTEFSAHLLKSNRFNTAAGILWLLCFGVGILFYAAWLLLIRRERIVYLHLDANDQVSVMEQVAKKRTRSDLATGGIMLAVAVLAIVFGTRGIIQLVRTLQQVGGVNICTAAHYSDRAALCVVNDNAISVQDVKDAKLVLGRVDGGSLSLSALVEVAVNYENSTGYVSPGSDLTYPVNSLLNGNPLSQGRITHVVIPLSQVLLSPSMSSATPGVYRVRGWLETVSLGETYLTLGETYLTVTQ